MGGGCGSGVGTMSTIQTVYAMRHGQKKIDSNNPSLTVRGQSQVLEATKKYLTGINFTVFFCGIHIRHVITAQIARVNAHLSHYIIRTPLLSLNAEMDVAADGCAMQCHNHPDGPTIGFRVDTWAKTDPALMDTCRNRFQYFIQALPKRSDTILAISSSPIIESAVLQPENTRLLGECGIIKYVINADGIILSSEIIFDGFFEKPPQKSE